MEMHHPHERDWDAHGGRRWSYLGDDARSRIRFFLAARLTGSNIDLGGGWDSPDSTSVAVDLSSACLERNAAPAKLQFNLDWMGTGRRLPYPDASFDSATMISVWQYLSAHRAILGEVRRVLKPGAKLYVISGQGAGLEACITTSPYAETVVDLLSSAGFDTLTENIPLHLDEVPFSTPGELRSVCARMPEPGASTDRPVARRRVVDPRDFTAAYVDWEMAIRTDLLSRTVPYPITGRHRELLRGIEARSEDLHARTGCQILIFAESCLPQQLVMPPPGGELDAGPCCVVLGDTEPGERRSVVDALNDLAREHGVGWRCTLRHFGVSRATDTVDGLVALLRGHAVHEDAHDAVMDTYARFVTAVPLNRFTASLQAQMRALMVERGGAAVSYLRRNLGITADRQTREIDGERRITRTIAAKERLEAGGEGIVDRGTHDVTQHLAPMRELLLARARRHGL